MSIAAAAMHASDGALGLHCDDVVHLCDAIAAQLDIYGEERSELLVAAQLHDIGKVAIPRRVLEKPGPLDIAEWLLIRQHTIEGARIIQAVPELHEVAHLVRHSHERWDGAGYPDGLTGTEIPLGSRIIFCADSFHAIRSDRPYCRGRSRQEALDEVKRCSGVQFDPLVVNALLQAADSTPRFIPGEAGTHTTSRARTLASLF